MVLHTNLFGYEEIVPGSTRLDDLDTLYSIVYMVLLLLNIIILLSVWTWTFDLFHYLCVFYLFKTFIFRWRKQYR